MSLDDRLTNYYRETVRVDGNTPNSRQRAKQAILSDLLSLIGEEAVRVPANDMAIAIIRNQLRQELREKAKEYCK